MEKGPRLKEREWQWTRGTETLVGCVGSWWMDFISHLRLTSIVGQSFLDLIALYLSALQCQFDNTSGMYLCWSNFTIFSYGIQGNRYIDVSLSEKNQSQFQVHHYYLRAQHYMKECRLLIQSCWEMMKLQLFWPNPEQNIMLYELYLLYQ